MLNQRTRGERKREAAERYWTALAQELKTGCKCTAFTFAPSATAAYAGQKAEILPCVCRSSPDVLQRLPSRVTALATELRDTLIAILPEVQGTERDMEATHRSIRDHIDPELIEQEAAHGVLDLSSLAHYLVPVLKAHCAPMRDELVDSMVRFIDEGQLKGDMNMVTSGLRCCFQILEVMKLDIANHQLRMVRPYLLANAADFERGAVAKAIGDRAPSDVLRKTRDWLLSAAHRQAIGVGKLSHTLLVSMVAEGVLEQLFNPQMSLLKQSLGSSGRTSRKVRAVRLPEPAFLPELLDLDVHRLQGLHSDVTDLSIMTLLMLLFRQLCGMSRRAPRPKEVAEVKQEILVLKRDLAVRIGGRNSASGSRTLDNPA